MSQFTTDLIAACTDEYRRWDNGAGRETWGKPQYNKDYYLFVKDYWLSIGNKNLDGRKIVKGIRPAWSSAFVSFCVKKAGAGHRFLYTQAHCHYINKAMEVSSNAANAFAFKARRPEEYRPKVGDIICAGREYASGYDYDQAELIYEADSFYPSHGDIVVNMTATHAHVMGGNIKNNVDRKQFKLTDAGFLRNRITSSGKELPWISILECLI